MSRSRTLHRCATAVACAAVVAGLAGCGAASTGESRGALAIVVGARNNTPPPELDGLAAQARDTAVTDRSFLSIVVADGRPFEAGHGVLQVNAANSIAAQEQQDANRRKVDQALDAAAAKTPEADLLAALDLAARAIHSRPGPHTIVVVDSGLSTTGALDFTQPGLLDADPKELAQSLADARELPDLHGDDVVFQGLGDVADPQQPLGRPVRMQLIAIWQAVAEASGAGHVAVEESPLEGRPDADLPSVTPVVPPSGVTCGAGAVVLTGADVAFRPDSSEFLDPAAAKAKVAPIAAQLVAGSFGATLVGTTARVGDDAGQVRLSQLRAQAVADLLTSLGVPADRLTVVGKGSHFDGYLADHDAAGHLVPAAAAANRRVTITPEGSATISCG